MTRRKTPGIAAALLLFSLTAAAQTTPAHFVVVVPVADMYKLPTFDADVVSQTPFGSDVIGLELNDKWAKIRTTSDDYVGWVQRSDLQREEPAALYASSGKVAATSALFSSIYLEPDIEKHRPIVTIPFGSRLEIAGEKQTPDSLFYSVRLPTGTSGWIQAGDVSLETKPVSIADAIALGKRFLGLPYRWGGTTSYGFDCSGFTQMLMRSRGISMPRDTGPQSRWDGTAPVDRSALEPGDLIFFSGKSGKVNHTGMYIGDGQFIHATRHITPAVQISRLSDEPWNTRYMLARRAK